MRAIPNVHVGRIWPAGFPSLNLKHIVFLKHAFLSYNKYSTRKFYLQIKLLCVMNLVLCDERTEGSQVEMAEQTLHLGSQHAIEVFNMLRSSIQNQVKRFFAHTQMPSCNTEAGLQLICKFRRYLSSAQVLDLKNIRIKWMYCFPMVHECCSSCT